MPRILSVETRRRVETIVASPCDGYLCDGVKPSIFTKRLTRGGSVTVQIQCLECGRSRGGPLKRADFPHWQDFPEWDDTLLDLRRDAIEKARQPYEIAQAETAARREAEASERRSEYHRWLLTSPDWRIMRDRVMRRAMFICEACLSNRATEVHHVTYRLGKLPPAWELRAVCRECHDRLHDWIGGGE